MARPVRREMCMTEEPGVFVGIDWATEKHVNSVLDEFGKRSPWRIRARPSRRLPTASPST